MEHPTGILNPRGPGFTLIEVLVALALTAVVSALAWTVLQSTRNVAVEIEKPLESSLTPLWNRFQFEFDRLMREPKETSYPPLRFSEESGLEMICLLPGPEQIPQQTAVHYYLENKTLMKISRIHYPATARTNAVLEGVRLFSITGKQEEVEIEHWPPEKETALPPRIEIGLQSETGEHERREFYLPVSFSVTPGLNREENREKSVSP